jgi:RNA polymerase sigma-70 factor (ECF subfamily)
LNGSTPKFERIVSDFGPLISRIANSYESDPGLREDLTQQILLAVWQAMPSWRRDTPLKNFIARIAQNRAINHVATEVRQPKGDEVDEALADSGPDPEEQVAETVNRNRLVEATRRLPPPQREVIILVLEGFNYAEIADMLNIAPAALAQRLARAKSALQAILEPQP